MSTVSPAEFQALRDELRDLAESMREVSQDGRALAAELANAITGLVAFQCDAIEERLAVAIDRLNQLDKDAA